MPLGTLERSPPPFFKQGPSGLSQLLFFAALSLFLMVADSRFQMADPLRATLATLLHPFQRGLVVPVHLWDGLAERLDGLDSAQARERQAQATLLRQAERQARMDELADENAQLRKLLGLRAALPIQSVAAEVLYEAADPFSRKLLIDRGSLHGVLIASPVLDAEGVVGQVTRVQPLSAEVTLLTDKDAAIPVLNERTQSRAAAFGDPSTATTGGGMELRFMPVNADVQAGDLLQTSGIDGIYPAGLPVARIAAVDRRAGSTFAKVTLAPLTRPDAVRHVLVIAPLREALGRPEEAASAAAALPAASASATAALPSRAPAARAAASAPGVAAAPAPRADASAAAPGARAAPAGASR
ncbi:rod shape-determining protein MreC [Piscinibacter sp. Jin2]|uniref:Cell shape-determining protein MreC n=1 Tax=Aquariibacter lacus TaxID=2801332 RepID=A0A9X0XCC9_9BURK|nr:rod shape-determining protein MreC [Piscinibacter lacus]MBL0718959.1 rod shape-determining protein MreC [Piscinibacter lacus]